MSTQTEPVSTRLKLHIRWMIRRDMAEALAIEGLSFGPAWDEAEFLRLFRMRNVIPFVVEERERVIGFMIYELRKTKLHLIKMAVHPIFRRMGVGSAMLAKAKSKLHRHRRTRITLVVDDANLATMQMLKAHGFRAIKVLRGHSEYTGEDAYLFRFALSREVLGQ